ncbi:lipopolysaccharide biosynthesis protein [Egicoccus halophilus]|uniref:Lipopolysaccharide biosynthesis protein n=1 Tax=Egicoccus halophilus TaxID=1670830 RepID=A0A8J3A774_9ACTN|nr:lipopolysaccharide biosynthesis protein [Egicoccus halophilus]GGI05396.1 lipopolysaccharide biosynthesis protein [Egicoccus halophilus]
MSNESATDSMSKRTWSGLQWTYGASIFGALLQVGYTAAMGRLLRPADFGVLAVATVFLRFGQYFAQMGVGPALVQAPSLTDRRISTAFLTNLGLSTAVVAVFVAIAGLAQNLLDDPVVVPVARVMALGLLFSALGATSNALLRRELDFRRLAIIQLVSFVIGYLVVGLGAALLGAGVWSLVAAHLSQSLLNTILTLLARPHPVRLGWNRRDAGALLRFGGRVSIISYAEFLGMSLDTLIIGRVAGGSALGQYNRAYLLVTLPLERLMQGVQSVLFPAFSRIQDERERLARVYRSALGIAAALLIPTAAGMAVAAGPLVRVVLGDQWDQAASVLPFLTVSAVGSLLALFGAVICEATADLNRKLALQVTHVLVLAGLLALAGSELRWLALAVAAAQMVRVVGYFGLMRRILGTTYAEHLRALAPALITAAVLAAVGIGIEQGAAAVSALPRLLLHVVADAVVLGASFRFGPLSGVRRDLADWLDKAGALGRLPEKVRTAMGLVT